MLQEFKVIKVSASTPVASLSGSILSVLKSGEKVELRAMGAGAISQMYKATAKARTAMATLGRDLLIRPGFDTIVEEENGEKKEKTVLLAHIVLY